MRGRGHTKKRRKKAVMTKTVAVRMDDSLYNWLVKAKEILMLEDLSSTVRTLLRIMQFLVESNQIKTPTQDLKEWFEKFLGDVNNQQSGDTPP